MGATSPPDDNSAALVAVSSPNRRGEEEQHHRYSSFQQQIIAMGRHPPRNLVLQDDIIAGRSADSKSHSPDNRAKGRIEDAGTACGLVVLAGAAGGAGGPDDGAAASPPPTVIAVAYRAGIVDIALIPAGVSPRWVCSGRSMLVWRMEVAFVLPCVLTIFRKGGVVLLLFESE